MATTTKHVPRSHPNDSQTEGLEPHRPTEETPPGAADNAGASEQRCIADPWRLGLRWDTLIWFGLIHVGALAALLVFSWQGLAVAVFFTWLTGAVGVCLGYHRLLTHASFRTYPFVQRALAVCGTLAGEGSPIAWVSVHRKHHHYSDREGDPHSPRDGGWWSHVLWMLSHQNDLPPEMVERYAKDLTRQRFMRFLDRTFLLWHLTLGGLLLAAGWAIWGPYVGVSMALWGMCLRLTFVLHSTWLVNSAAHMWGYRNYETKDDSRNLWWVGLLAFGEGWHNNHHAFPGRARHGHRWWEFDFTYRTICLMERLGLAWRVNHGRAKKDG